jgi:hypothetical protein
MINCIVICLTIFASIVYILHWARKMAKDELPHFIIGHLEPTPEERPEVSTPVIGFTVPDEDLKEELSDQEQRDKTLRDMASTYTAILRGDFDLDEL